MKRETEDKIISTSHSIDQISLEEIKESLYDNKVIKPLSNIFKVLGDPTRLKIIYVLSKSPLCVCDIANLLDMTQSSISHQLRILRDSKLVKFKREGKLVVYYLDDDHVLELFNQGLNHVMHE